MTHEEAMLQAWPGGVTTHTLSSVEQAVTVGSRLPFTWFRGHSRIFGTLAPTVFRDQYAGESIEYWAGERFRQRARMFTSKVPAYDDYLGWLLLMQHFGTPTRLLDWTDSILTALYFAVREHPHESAEIWCMRPDALNWHSNWRVCGPSSPPVIYLAAEVFT